MTEAALGFIYMICLLIEVPIYIVYGLLMCIGKRDLPLSIAKAFFVTMLLAINLYEFPLAIYIDKFYLTNILFIGVLGYLLVKHVKEILKLSKKGK